MTLPYQTSLLNQDGNGPTDLERVFFSDTGLLTAVFADGSSRPIYRIPLATVPAPAELQGQSGNAYAITARFWRGRFELCDRGWIWSSFSQRAGKLYY